MISSGRSARGAGSFPGVPWCDLAIDQTHGGCLELSAKHNCMVQHHTSPHADINIRMLHIYIHCIYVYIDIYDYIYGMYIYI
jgi:hypothetical protein